MLSILLFTTSVLFCALFKICDLANKDPRADNTAVPSREKSHRRPSHTSSHVAPSTSYSNNSGYSSGYGVTPYANPVPPVSGGGGYMEPPPVDTTSQKIYVPNHLVGGECSVY